MRDLPASGCGLVLVLIIVVLLSLLADALHLIA